MFAIEINDLTLAYSSRNIISHFNASIEQGEFIGIFGPNGAGKSSLLRAILGLNPPLSGDIKIFDKSARRGYLEIGYVPQSRKVTHGNRLSAKSRVLASLNGTRWGVPIHSRAEHQMVDQVLSMVGAESFAHRAFCELSGGEQQQILLAQALLNRPKILILDEPLSNLDPHHQEGIVQLVRRIQLELKVTVLFTAHDLNPLLDVMNRIIYLARGNAAIGTVDEIVTNDRLSWLYRMPMEVIRHRQRLFVINREQGELIGNDAHSDIPA